MTIEERALQFWSVLALAATHHQVLTHKKLWKLTGMAMAGHGEVLGRIARYCSSRGIPTLTVLVVQEGTGLPNPGVIAENDVTLAQTKVFGFDWIERGAPEVADLE